MKDALVSCGEPEGPVKGPSAGMHLELVLDDLVHEEGRPVKQTREAAIDRASELRVGETESVQGLSKRRLPFEAPLQVLQGVFGGLGKQGLGRRRQRHGKTPFERERTVGV
jgi:hypothetical protein